MLDREPDTHSVVLADEGQGTDPAFDIAGIVFDQHFIADAVFRVVEVL